MKTNRQELKAAICRAIDAQATEIVAYAQDVAKEPELGFKEHKTAAKTAALFQTLGLPHETGLALTGVKARAKGRAAGPTAAILAELDAISCPDSAQADPATGAAHACGHNIQLAAMIGAAFGLVKSGAMQALDGDVVFFAVPAEEFVELEFRNRLREEGKLHYLSGKQELIYRGAFDDIQLAMQMHSDKYAPQPTVAIGESSNGFIAKAVRYIGKEAHAADAPELGVNALNAAMLGLMGVHALRETFRDEDVVRVHPIITKGGDLVNCVPADVRLETYVRAKTVAAMEATHGKIDRALRAGGDAVGAQTVIQTLPGYLPLTCNACMNALFVENAKLAEPNVTIKDAGHFSASTDMGDVSHILPLIHPFIGGTDGALHTREFHVVDYQAACLLPAKAMAMTAVDLLFDKAAAAQEILCTHKPLFTKQEYIRKMDGYFNC